MPKTVRGALKMRISRFLLRSKGVIVHHHSLVSKCEFEGSAVIEPYSRLVGIPRIQVGQNLYVNGGCHLQGDIVIGDDVMIGPKTVIWTRDHGLARGARIRTQEHTNGRVNIGDDVWIGASAVILKGVTLGEGAVVGAGSVVTRDVAPYTIVAGNPAKPIGERL
ncbi:acyltransferase [Knoellia sp. 3-2P3]|uniref:acyltransferase n=1 Tax=unclassified Knoellia TaxID=2618719 RepID=UPI0023DA277D|nr:acyltransferase [Knoellia sp. 3-2P3]MDF2094127.1 acyltransferase [Knoellia sp. 3-2P3]